MKKENIIAVIPSYIDDDDAYLSRWVKLLNNKNLTKMLKKTDTYIYFYSKKKADFKSDRIILKRIIRLSKVKLLVTDDLRVNKKFIKQMKPIIYYRFNKIKNFNRKCTFGRIIGDEEDVVNKIIGYVNMNYRVENYYQRKIKTFLERKK